MAVSAYVLITALLGKAADVTSGVSEIEGVKSVESVTGEFDAIVRIEAESNDELGKIVANKIQNVEGISETYTCIIINLS